VAAGEALAVDTHAGTPQAERKLGMAVLFGGGDFPKSEQFVRSDVVRHLVFLDQPGAARQQ